MSHSNPVSFYFNLLALTDVGLFSAPSFADIDNDGDLDALIGAENGDVVYFENVGDATNPEFANPVRNPFGLQSVTEALGGNGIQNDNNPVFIDLDGDGDLDAIAGTFPFGSQLFFENIGTSEDPNFAAPSNNPFGLQTVGEFSSPSFVDIDNDGDFDAFIGDYPNGQTHFFENIGDATTPSFAEPVINAFGLENVGSFSSPTFADVDQDGDFDGFIGTEQGDIAYFENIGTAQNPNFAAPVHNPFGLENVGQYSSPEFADIDGDGDLDAFIGVISGETFFFENRAEAPGATPQFVTYQSQLIEGTNDGTVFGTSGNDLIQVEGGNQTIYAGEGFNVVRSGSGNDQLFFEQGDDIADAGDGNNVVYAKGGNDSITAGSGNDRIFLGDGNDTAITGGGDDLIYGHGGNDTILAGEGNDRIFVENGGRHWIDGGAGNDTIQLNFSQSEVVLREGDGFALIRGYSLDNAQFVLAGGLEFTDLRFVQVQGHTEIRANGSTLAEVEWVNAAQLGVASHFFQSS